MKEPKKYKILMTGENVWQVYKFDSIQPDGQLKYIRQPDYEKEQEIRFFLSKKSAKDYVKQLEGK